MATYLDNAGVTQILTKIKSLLAKKAEITAIPTKVSQLTNDSSYQTNSEVSTKIGTELGKLDYDVKDQPEDEDNYNPEYFLFDITQTDGKSVQRRLHLNANGKLASLSPSVRGMQLLCQS